jgi:NADPH2:quinone reductase
MMSYGFASGMPRVCRQRARATILRRGTQIRIAVRSSGTKIMKAIQISRTGGTEVLEHVDRPQPQPGAGEVVVRAHAIGVSYFDLMIRSGRYRWMPPLPFVLGNDMSGHVAAVGTGVRKLKVGDAVFVAGWDADHRGGLYAEYAAAPAGAVWPLPQGVDLDEAVTLANYQLACILLYDAARGIEPGSVVVYGAAGGVGTALCDVARAAGARVIGLAGSRQKCDFVRKRGAAAAIDHTAEPVAERVLGITGGRGADIVFNHVAGNTLKHDVTMLAPLGMVVSYAVVGGLPEGDLFKDMRANIERSPAVRCFTMHTYDHLPERRQAAMQRAIDLLASGKVRPALAAPIPLAEAARAHALIESRAAFGKVLLKP